MVHFRTLDVRWIWRYRTFYIAGLAVMSIQIFLAVIFFTLYDETDKNSSNESYLKNTVSFNQKTHQQYLVLSNNDQISGKPKDSDIYKNIIDNNSAITKKSSSIDGFGLSVACNVTGREPLSAISRAKTSYCKQLILNTTCLLQNDQLFPKSLPHSCPANGLQSSKSLGCFRDSSMLRLLSGAYYNSSKFNSQTYCINRCLQAGFSYAGVQFAGECFCGNEEPPITSQLPDSSCNMKCPSNSSQFCGGYFTMNIFETGVAKFKAQTANEISFYNNETSNQSARVVFLLTLNGRSIRQVLRLIKILFHRDHFFFIHVDARQDYLFSELQSLELRLSNVRLSRRRHSTIWGGASLLTMLLESMSELIQSSWDWDFLINLSESDFPIKSNKELVTFLSNNRNRNFVKSHRRDVHHFIQKQGLDKTFIECDEHMWRIGNRKLPTGIVIDGGSDWIALSRQFINYIVTAQNDELLDGLRVIFKHTLLPAESFFHTVLRNSIFCDTYIDNNLHVTNWKRHLGCKCQYKHVVDWCGCSPNAFTVDDWHRIQSTENKSLFFARKFDPTVNQQIINNVEEWLYGHYTDEYDSKKRYWQNVFYHADRSPPPDDAVISVCSSLSRHALLAISGDNFMCSKWQFRKLLQVHSFYDEDVHKGILVNFEAISEANSSLLMEVWYEIRPSFTLYPPNELASRFTNLIVNTNFDAKEKMSRNYVNAVGPFGEPVLIYSITSGSPASNISVVWVNPVKIVEDVSEIALDESLGIHHVNSNLKTPLLPGLWQVYLIHLAEVLARATFLVTPLESISEKPITTDQARSTHFGSEQSFKVSDDWSNLIPVLNSIDENYDVNLSRQDYVEKSQYTGTALQQWLDDLVIKSYNSVDMCYNNDLSKSDDQWKCIRENVQPCETSPWSSFSPDPKTHITSVNKSTGRLNR